MTSGKKILLVREAPTTATTKNPQATGTNKKNIPKKTPPTIMSTKRKRPRETNKLTPEEVSQRMAAAKRFKEAVDEGAAVLDARKAKPGTNGMAVILRKFPSRLVTTAKGGKVPSTGFVALVGAFQIDDNVDDELDPVTGTVTIAGMVDQDNDVTKPVTLHPYTVYTFSMFRKLSQVREGSVVKLFGISARFWTPPEEEGSPRRTEMLFYGAANIQPMVPSNNFAFVDDLLRAMPNVLTRWVDEPERPDPVELAQLVEERKAKMDSKRRGGRQQGGGDQDAEGGKRKRKARRGGKANFFIHFGHLPEEEQKAELYNTNGFFSNTIFGTTGQSWFYRSQEVDADLGNRGPPLGKSHRDNIKMAVRLMCCQWMQSKGGYSQKVEFTAKATLFQRMLAPFAVQTPKCWDLLANHIPDMRFLVFMNEDRLETAQMEYNDPDQRDPLNNKFGAYCYIMFVQRVWFDAAKAYTRVGIPVTLDYVASKLIHSYDPTAPARSLDHRPANDIDSNDLSTNVVCLNEFHGDLRKIGQTADRFLAIINYVAEPKYQADVEEIIAGLTAEEGTRFLKMKESTSRSALDQLKADFGPEHGVVVLDHLLQRVNMRDTELRCVFFAIPKVSDADRTKLLELRAEFLGNAASDEEEESDYEAMDDEDTTTAAQTQEASAWQSLDDEEEDTAMLEAVERLEKEQTDERRRHRHRHETASSIPPLEEDDETTATQLIDALGDSSLARGADEELGLEDGRRRRRPRRRPSAATPSAGSRRRNTGRHL